MRRSLRLQPPMHPSSACSPLYGASTGGSNCLPSSANTYQYRFSDTRTFIILPPRQLPRPSRSLKSPRWANTRQSGGSQKPEKEDGSDSSDGLPVSENSEQLEVEDSDDSNSAARLEGEEGDRPPASSRSSSGSSSSPSSNGGDDTGSSSATSSPSRGTPSSSSSAISKQSVPENYPQVLALPIARRPLFPGFYKAVVIRNPSVVAAVKEMMKRGQPYLGAFLLKDDNTDSDTITDINSVYNVGVFAQITSVFSTMGGVTKEGEEGRDEGLTAVLYPHRRIKLTELINKVGETPMASIEELNEPIEEGQAIISEQPLGGESGAKPIQDSTVSPVAHRKLLKPPTGN